MLLFGFQDSAVQDNFAKWEALLQKGTMISASLLHIGGVFTGRDHSQRWREGFANCGKFG